jgi:hypothetical protein
MKPKWKCLNCGETKNIYMVPIRLSDYFNEWNPEENFEDKLIYHPKYSVTRIMDYEQTGDCYCSYRCFMYPTKLRAKL